MKLDFGTAGIRGIVGDEEHQLNNVHAARVFDGFARYILNNVENAEERGIVIGRDNRKKGKTFSHIAFKIFTSYGIKVHFNNEMLATPFISYITRSKKAAGAINITASHNPKEYNGIKVYDQTGCQLLPKEIEKLKNYFYEYNEYLKYQDFKFDLDELKSKFDFIIPITNNDYDKYIDEILKINFNNIDLSNINVTYSPLHGTGFPFVKKIAEKLSLSNIHYEYNEINEDENFSSVPNPNPETKEAFANSIKEANLIGSDVVIVTDPDSDRVGIAIKDLDGEFKILNGNEVAILITDYLIRNKKRDQSKLYYLIYSFVSTSLPAKMCKDNNIKSYITETGFKWIGNKINSIQDEEFFFGFEESYGSLINENLAHDKDAIQGFMALLIIASEAQNENINLLEKLDAIYKQYGYMRAASFSFNIEEELPLKNIKIRFKNLSLSNNLIDFNEPQGDIEPNDMLMYLFEDKLTWVSIRPSGTEPKIKLYIHVIGSTQEEANEIFEDLKEKTNSLFIV